MKKLLLTCALVGAVTASFAQGTVQFSNGALSRLSVGDPGSAVQIPLTANYTFGLFYGIGESTSLTFLSAQLGANSTASLGVIVNPTDRKSPLNTVGIPGTTPGQADVWIQFKGWESSFGTDWARAETQGAFFGSSKIVNVAALGPATGPGVAIWQGATGTVTTQIQAFSLTSVPEPTTLALAGLGVAAMLIFRRRS